MNRTGALCAAQAWTNAALTASASDRNDPLFRDYPVDSAKSGVYDFKTPFC
jgi:hypothetical protein